MKLFIYYFEKVVFLARNEAKITFFKEKIKNHLDNYLTTDDFNIPIQKSENSLPKENKNRLVYFNLYLKNIVNASKDNNTIKNGYPYSKYSVHQQTKDIFISIKTQPLDQIKLINTTEASINFLANKKFIEKSNLYYKNLEKYNDKIFSYKKNILKKISQNLFIKEQKNINQTNSQFSPLFTKKYKVAIKKLSSPKDLDNTNTHAFIQKLSLNQNDSQPFNISENFYTHTTHATFSDNKNHAETFDETKIKAYLPKDLDNTNTHAFIQKLSLNQNDSPPFNISENFYTHTTHATFSDNKNHAKTFDETKIKAYLPKDLDNTDTHAFIQKLSLNQNDSPLPSNYLDENSLKVAHLNSIYDEKFIKKLPVKVFDKILEKIDKVETIQKSSIKDKTLLPYLDRVKSIKDEEGRKKQRSAEKQEPKIDLPEIFIYLEELTIKGKTNSMKKHQPAKIKTSLIPKLSEYLN